MKDDGEAAIARERAAHEEADRLREAAYDGLQRELLAKQAPRPVSAYEGAILAEKGYRPRTPEELEFAAKLAAWREQGAPPYHGPRAAK